jgi:hypothetical protein
MRTCTLIGAVLILCLNGAAAQTTPKLLPVASVLPWPTSGGDVVHVVDNLATTSWTSSPCRSGAWRTNPVFNPLYGVCSGGAAACTGSCNANLTAATDGSPYTAGSAVMSHAEGRSYVHVSFPGGDPRHVRTIYLRGAWPVNTTLVAMTPHGDFHVATLDPALNYRDLNFPAPAVPISGVKLQSITKDGVMRGYCYSGVGDCKTLTVTEVAVQTEECFEQLTIDLGADKVVTKLDVRFNGYTGGTISTSLDDLNYVYWTDLNALPPSYLLAQSVKVPEITARYVRFR